MGPTERPFSFEESQAIPKQRKPPSQRPERQMDETALAIARLKEETKAEKSAESRKGEPGSTGIVEYHLTAAPKFGETNVTLSESITATDEGGRQLRHSEIDRIFTLHDIQLKPNEEPLWPRMFPRKNDPSTSIAEQNAKRPVLPKKPARPGTEVPPTPPPADDVPPPPPSP